MNHIANQKYKMFKIGGKIMLKQSEKNNIIIYVSTNNLWSTILSVSTDYVYI